MSERKRVVVELAGPATEMAQEEIEKQLAFLSRTISNVRFTTARTLEFDAPTAEADQLAEAALARAKLTQKTLRSLERKIAYRSSYMDAPVFRGGAVDGIEFEGPGLGLLSGVPLQLFEYFDRRFAEFGKHWRPAGMRAPTLIPTTVLARCDYFRSFPQSVTFAAHLPEEPSRVEHFRARHHDRETLDPDALGDMVTPEACLSPAVCYHAYYANRDRVLPEAPVVYEMVGKCFRYESSNTSDLRRLWDFTMREVVFLGAREQILAERAKAIALFQQFLEDHQLAAEIRTASDPFFIAPDAGAKTYFQLSSDTKYEISLLLPDQGRLAVGSFNYHGDFFGKAFNCTLPGGGPMHSVCFAWGLERWVHGFLAQHGADPARWPDVMRGALSE
ncbi:MAG: hypothetical protein H6Q90_586 [Deltaproteobacteria bacterium]|nr:hypothetical protein [Deltaproteobacteria bacterium]